jgi:hypothetical protein
MPAEAKRQIQLNPSQVYLGNPELVTPSMQQAMNKREQLVRVANMYRAAGLGAEYSATLDKINETDESLLYLQGMQGITELSRFNDPRRLSGVLTFISGGPVDIQMRTDGTYNYLANGQIVEEGLTQDELIGSVRSTFDTDYTKRMAERADLEYKTLLGLRKEAAKAQYGLDAEIAKLQVLSNNDLRKLLFESRLDKDGKSTPIAIGANGFVQRDGNELIIYNPNAEARVDANGVASPTTIRIPLSAAQQYFQ